MQGHAACEMSGNFDYLSCGNLEWGKALGGNLRSGY
jgi:hypothetical protein